MVIYIAPPCLYDSADEISTDVTVALEQNGDECIITYTPNAEWMNAPERIWPVVIDPDTLNIPVNDQIDNYVYNGQSGTLSNADTVMYAGCRYVNNAYREHWAYWRVSSMPA
jgi:hypothetical protein